MKILQNTIDYLALLFGIRTANNTEGYNARRSWLRTLALPFLRVVLLFLAAGVLLLILTSLLAEPYVKERNTAKQLKALSNELLRHQQKQLVLPAALHDFVANDPLKRDLTLDSWGNAVRYLPNPDGRTFTLISAGQDQQLNSPDDIVVKTSK